MNMKLAEFVADDRGAVSGAPPVRVRAEIDPSLPLATVDGEQIRQMIANLVQNGVDAVAQRVASGDKSAAAAPGEVIVSAGLSAARDMVLLRVSDNGAGMPDDVVKDIFTPFYTTKQLGQGTGMGLSIVYGVVKMHAGEITVDSAVGKGTTFLVRIPVGGNAKEASHELGTDDTAG